MVTDILGKLFQAQVLTHYWHLRTSSYAEHKALNKFYEELVDMMDSLAEALIGKYGTKPEIPKMIMLDKPDAKTYLKELGDYMDVYIQQASPDCQDLMIDVKNLINTTLYLLELK